MRTTAGTASGTGGGTGEFDPSLPLNLQNLQALLEFYFSDRREHWAPSDFVEELARKQYTLARLARAVDLARPHIPAFEREVGRTCTRTGAARLALLLVDAAAQQAWEASWAAQDEELDDEDLHFQSTLRRWIPMMRSRMDPTEQPPPP